MDLFSMIANAQVVDADGECAGPVVGIHVVGGKMVITAALEAILEEEDDGDDPDEEEAEPEVSDNLLRVVAGNEKV